MRPELGLLILPDRPLPELVELGCRAERLGYDALWVADEKFYRDPWVVLTALARETRRARLGTGVTEPYARHPALVAMAAATLAELAPGRVRVGLGAGGPGFPALGVERRRPARALPEAVHIIRGLLAGERVEYEGEVLSFRGGALEFPSTPLPIYVAARGPRMLTAAARVADGVIAAPFASVRAVEQVSELVHGAAARAGRDAPRMVARVDVCIGRSRQEARDAVRYFVALPVWVSYPDWSYLEPLRVELPPELRRLVARRDYRDIARAGRLLPGEMIDHFAVAGGEDEVGERLRGLVPLVDELIVHPVGSPAMGVERVVERVAEIWAGLGPVPGRGGMA
jgi:5,10-methylenetetrahydromethanopterin reductase